MTTWTHAILEIYEPEKGWPSEGTPADWIEQRLVMYTGGDLENLIHFVPLRLLFWYKAKSYGRSVRDFLLYNIIGDITGQNKRDAEELEQWFKRLDEDSARELVEHLDEGDTGS